MNYDLSGLLYATSVIIGFGAAGTSELFSSRVISGVGHVVVVVKKLKRSNLMLFSIVIWTAQGCCLTVNSSDETMGRNSGIFWAFMQCRLGKCVDRFLDHEQRSQTGHHSNSLDCMKLNLSPVW